MNAQAILVHEVDIAVAHGTPERRVETLRRVADLFVHAAPDYTDEQIALFDDVIGRLEEKIEVAVRAELARRLAVIPNAPPRIIRKLAFDDEIIVAGPVLSQSERLSDDMLIENARTKSQLHLLAISKRKTLSEPVTDVLTERGERDVLAGVVANAGAHFSGTGYAALVGRAEDDELILSIGERQGLPRHFFLKLVAKASDNVRRRLEEHNPQAANVIRETVGKIVRDVHAATKITSRDLGAATVQAASLHRSGQLNDMALTAFAKAGQLDEIVASLAALCDVPIDVADQAMNESRANNILILMRAAGLSWPTAKAILLRRAMAEGISVYDLEETLATYERLNPSTAKQILQFHKLRTRN